MNKNKNILLMIGVITLSCSQLFGPTRKQFQQLKRLEKELKANFTTGMPGENQMMWVNRNENIVRRIRQIDSRVAVTYQQEIDRLRASVLAAREKGRAVGVAERRRREAERAGREAERAREITAAREAGLRREAATAQREAEAREERLTAAIEEAEQKATEAEQALNAAREEAPEEIVNRLEQAKTELQDAKKELETAQSVLENVKTEFEKGTATISELQKARTTLTDQLTTLQREVDEGRDELNRFSKSSKNIASPLLTNIQNFIKNISVESDKDAINMNFNKLNTALTEIQQEFEKSEPKLTSDDKEALKAKLVDSKKELANAILANAIKQSPEIITILKIMTAAITPGTGVTVDPKPEYFRTQIDKISVLLNSISQEGLFLDLEITNLGGKDNKKNAANEAKGIVEQTDKLYLALAEYMKKLNNENEKKRSDKGLTKEDFTKTVEAIQALETLQTLYLNLKKTFISDKKQFIEDQTNRIEGLIRTLSGFKVDLYNTFTVRETRGIIAIHKPGRTGAHAWPEVAGEDPLSNIVPNVGKMTKKEWPKKDTYKIPTKEELETKFQELEKVSAESEE